VQPFDPPLLLPPPRHCVVHGSLDVHDCPLGQYEHMLFDLQKPQVVSPVRSGQLAPPLVPPLDEPATTHTPFCITVPGPHGDGGAAPPPLPQVMYELIPQAAGDDQHLPLHWYGVSVGQQTPFEQVSSPGHSPAPFDEHAAAATRNTAAPTTPKCRTRMAPSRCPENLSLRD
jgi:hypothetical protein